MDIDDSYRGREHSYIKHELLKGYLEVLLSVVGVAGTKEFVYVDCFAGPWGDDTEAMTGTSIAISLVILSKVRETLASVHGITGTRFRAIYIEENRKRFSRLQDYLANNCPTGIDCHALNGDYSDLQDEILGLCGNRAFAFFFIDPLGWTDVGMPKFRKLLRRKKSEFLITFMYDFLNRAIGMQDFRNQVSAMLGELTEQEFKFLSGLLSTDRADWVVRKYREQIKAEMGSDGAFQPRSFHADVLHKDKERVHYHLVYLTRHPKGIVKFADASEKVALIQRTVRIQKKFDAQLQSPLFSAEDIAGHDNSSRANLSDVKAYWLDRLTSDPIVYDETCLADMIEETGWLPRDFQHAFKELLAEKKVENMNGNPRRTKHYVHFDKGERLRRCV